MKVLFSFVFLLLMCLFPANVASGNIVTSTKKIELKGFPVTWNPSLVETKEGFLLTFRYSLAPTFPWISYIGVVMLNSEFEPISEPQLLQTRKLGDPTSSQAEDARILNCDGNLYLVYNDNIECEDADKNSRRDMFVAKLSYEGNTFSLSEPLKVYHPRQYLFTNIQKNWVPFDWKGTLLLAYSLNPHKILYPSLATGESQLLCQTDFKNDWPLGSWRGGTPAVLVNGKYLAFFHSSIKKRSKYSKGDLMFHYFMGAYQFSPEPPFEITAVSPSPIKHKTFYTLSDFPKRVIFPGGFVVKEDKIYLAYGKDDTEMWIATLNKQKLLNSLKSVKKKKLNSFNYLRSKTLETLQLKRTIFDSMKELQGWCSEEKASFLVDCILTMQPKTIVEIGVFEGKSLIPMAYALKHNGQGEIYGIDSWDPVASARGLEPHNYKWWRSLNHDEIFKSLKQKIKKFELNSYIKLIHSTSSKATIPVSEIDILHIDGNHSAKACYRDVNQWVPKVRSGGLIILNDINWASTENAVQWLNTHCIKINEFKNDNIWGVWLKP